MGGSVNIDAVDRIYSLDKSQAGILKDADDDNGPPWLPLITPALMAEVDPISMPFMEHAIASLETDHCC